MKLSKWKTFVALTLIAVLTVTTMACKGETKTEVDRAVPAGNTWTVTFFDSDGVSVLEEATVADGASVEKPGLARDGYIIKDFYATPALLIPFDFTAPITADTSVFVAWQSSVADERPWMLAGSLAGYPSNNWGHAWPQDEFRLQPVEGEFNTFFIEVNLYEGDEFKIAVIDEDYGWADTIDSSALIDRTAMTGGQDAFDTGANVKVLETGKYKLTLTTDAETLALCKLAYEKIGEADELAIPEFDFQIQGTFNNWGSDDPEGDRMIRDGDGFKWMDLLSVTDEMCDADTGMVEFGIKDMVKGDWYDGRNLDATAEPNFKVPAGAYLVYVEIELVNNLPVLKDIFVEEVGIYVVGTCGNGNWAADANADNTAYQMQEQDDGSYALAVNFTDADTADWSEGKVAFKVVIGTKGVVILWIGNETGDNFMVDPGAYTIVLDVNEAGSFTVVITPA